MAEQSPENPAPNPKSPVFIPADWNLTELLSSATNTTNQRIIGQVIMVARTSLPSADWLWCDGASYATSQYATLFSIIGYTYGGAGATFNVPNFLGKSPVGTDAVGTLSTTYQGTPVVSSGNRSISVAQLAIHSHNYAHIHEFTQFSNSVGSQVVNVNAGVAFGALQNVGSITGTTVISPSETTNTGTGTDYLPPFSVIGFCIRVS
jgi:hypothetical protein